MFRASIKNIQMFNIKNGTRRKPLKNCCYVQDKKHFPKNYWYVIFVMWFCSQKVGLHDVSLKSNLQSLGVTPLYI